LGQRTPNDTEEKGVYTILISIYPPAELVVGRLGCFRFSGLYTYTGSAIGKGSSSLGGRVSRHLSKTKKQRWHIDYLLSDPNTIVRAIVTSLTRAKSKECKVSEKILDQGGHVSIERFGSSDCACNSHLAHLEADSEEAIRIILDAHRGAGLEPRVKVET
jgi:endonuclease-3